MKNILGVIGSPRKQGNTHILVEKILDGAKEKGAETDIIFLTDYHIKECNGCHQCWKGKECSKKDGMNKLYGKIGNSDLIIFGTPVYWYGPTALMKGFIDRFVYFNCPENRIKIKDKEAVLAVPFEEENMSEGDLLVAFFEKCCQYLEMNLSHKILVPGVGKKGAISHKTSRLQEGYELGKMLASS